MENSLRADYSAKSVALTYAYTSLFCVAIGTMLWALNDQQLIWANIGVSLCIGLSIVTSFLVFRPWADRLTSPYIAPIPIVAVGLAVGLFLAGWLVIGSPSYFFSDEWTSIVLGVFFGIVGYLIFSARERVANLRAQLAETEVQRETQEKRMFEAQLKLLQAQTEPHFLFNTLSNIAGMIKTKPEEAEQTLVNLTTLLRSSLRRTREKATTLGEELEIINAYLEIQKIRMKNRLDFHIDVDAGCRSLELPPMLLQPLVENAVKHGIDPLEEGGQLAITAQRTAEGTTLTVADTGIGVQDHQTNTGTGLTNIRRRLSALYDGAARLELKDNVPHGLITTLYIPDARANA